MTLLQQFLIWPDATYDAIGRAVASKTLELRFASRPSSLVQSLNV